MVKTIKSVLLIDYDSIYRSLGEIQPGAGELLGSRAGVWLEAIEGGDIIDAPYLDPDVRRRFQTKRCYADPRLLGKNRGWLTANGIQIVDCTPSGGLVRGAADINLTLDALDAAESDPEEIIILSAETDLTPLLFRLRAMNQKVLIYVTDQTAGSYKTFADGAVEEARLVEMLVQPTEASIAPPQGTIPRPPRISVPPRPEGIATSRQARPERPPEVRGADQTAPRKAKPTASGPSKPIDREALASLVRRIHEATNVPLFSPRAFAELFRLIAQDVAEHGYKFSATTDRVTAGMNKLGRNVSKRQVGFVVKGLALRGHVFTEGDTPGALAAVFHEQVMYLVESTDLDLTEVETGLVQAWLVGSGKPGSRAGSPEGRPAPKAEPPTRSRPPSGAAEQRDRPTSSSGSASSGAASSSSGATIRPEQDEALAARTDRMEEAVKPADLGRARDRGPMRTTSRPSRVVEEAQPVAPAVEASFARRVGRNGAAAAAPRSRPRPDVADDNLLRDADLEDSIMSAIADAVDVLADDGPQHQPIPGARSSMSRRSAPIAPEVELPNDARDDSEDPDEIGDEIQRILASYSDPR